jgi:hypothetical protein
LIKRFPSKSEKSNRRTTQTATELQQRWTKRFFGAFLTVDEDGVPNYVPNTRDRRYAPSRSETQAFKACQKFQDDLTVACEKLRLRVKGKDLAGFDIPKNATKLQRMVEMDLNFWRALRSNVTKGKVRVIRTFMAELILAGFELHQDDEIGLELMRRFFEKDSEFSRQVAEWYDKAGEKLINALCGKQNGKPLKRWKKDFRDLAFKNIVLPSDDPKKSNQARSRKGSPKDRRTVTQQEQEAKQRTKVIEERVKRLAQSIRRK